jgi:hypothetical protein
VRAIVQRLRAEIASDRQAFEDKLRELSALDLQTPSPSTLAHAAVLLHHAYGAVESAMARVARTMEGAAPEGADSHRALLEAMALAIDSVRPAVLSPESLGVLATASGGLLRGRLGLIDGQRGAGDPRAAAGHKKRRTRGSRRAARALSLVRTPRDRRDAEQAAWIGHRGASPLAGLMARRSRSRCVTSIPARPITVLAKVFASFVGRRCSCHSR